MILPCLNCHGLVEALGRNTDASASRALLSLVVGDAIAWQEDSGDMPSSDFSMRCYHRASWAPASVLHARTWLEGELMDTAQRHAMIDRYREGYQVVVAALEGITPKELDARPAPGEFTAREVVHHLADSVMMSAMRLRRLIAEEEPVIHAYDENGFARSLYYAQRPIEPSLEALRAARATTASILNHLTPAEWERSGTHTESGYYSVSTWLEIYAAHAHEHAEQIRQARRAAL